ncbi:LacI family transcriptional regulator, partial [bacterium]
RQEEHLIWHANFGSDAARTAATKILASPDRPDALVVLDDYMAMGVVLAARELGLRIPQDIGMVAFNDSNLCDLLEGGLSSVSLNIDEMVRAAGDALLAIIEGRPEDAPVRTIVPCELRARGSSIREGVPR